MQIPRGRLPPIDGAPLPKAQILPTLSHGGSSASHAFPRTRPGKLSAASESRAAALDTLPRGIIRERGEDHICVQLLMFTGDEVEFLVALETVVHDLKSEIEKALQVPSFCQILLASGVILEDDELLSSHCAMNTDELILQMIVNSEEALKRVAESLHGTADAKLEALNSCLRLQLLLDEEISANIIRLLGDAGNTWQIKTSALHVISKSAPQGNILAAQALADIVRSGTHPLRGAALPALARVAPRGHEPAVLAVGARCTDRAHDVRVAAHDALCQLVLEGDERALAIASDGLRDESKVVREAAYRLLTCVAAGDHELLEAASSVIQCQEDSMQ